MYQKYKIGQNLENWQKKKHNKSFRIRQQKTMPKKNIKFALVIELVQLKFTYIMVLKWPKLGHKEWQTDSSVQKQWFMASFTNQLFAKMF